MPKPKKRDSAYWLARLERDHPSIHARLLAGAIPSVRAACAEAGLIRLPSRLDANALMRRGKPTEEFLDRLREWSVGAEGRRLS